MVESRENEITMDAYFVGVNQELQQKERQKAREIRESQWWKNQKGNGRCYYCGGQFRPAELTMDHKVPVIRGGRSTRSNLVPCCKPCNNEKKHLLVSEWITQRQEQGLPQLACAKHELY